MKTKTIIPKKNIFLNKSTAFLLMVAFCCFIPVVLSGQIDTVWVRSFNGPGDSIDVCNGIAVDNQGNVYVTGESWRYNDFEDYTTIRYDSSGIERWVNYYGPTGGGVDIAYAIATDNKGYIYVTGESDDGSTTWDYATIKYDSAGAEKWIARYNGPGSNADEAYAIAVDDHGNVYVTGRSYGVSNDDYAAIKYDSAGAEKWVARYNGTGNGWDIAKAIAADNVGSVYITGGCIGAGTNRDCVTIKYDSMGVEKWVARYNGIGNYIDEANALAIDSFGNVYVTGRTYGDTTDYDYVTIKYDSNGGQRWVATYNGTFNWHDGANAIAVDNLGNTYVTGSCINIGNSYDYVTIKYDSIGAEKWVAIYDSAGADVAYAIKIDGERNIYITGGSTGSGSDYDYVTIKYDSTGAEKWIARYNGTWNSRDEAYALALDDQGCVYVSGRSIGVGTYYDYVTIKYRQTPGAIETVNDGSRHALIQIYPNPVKDNCSIEYVLSKASKVNISVYDATGRMIKEIVNENQGNGSHLKTLNMVSVPPGVYFVKLSAEGLSETRKITLIKQ